MVREHSCDFETSGSLCGWVSPTPPSGGMSNVTGAANPPPRGPHTDTDPGTPGGKNWLLHPRLWRKSVLHLLCLQDYIPPLQGQLSCLQLACNAILLAVQYIPLSRSCNIFRTCTFCIHIRYSQWTCSIQLFLSGVCCYACWPTNCLCEHDVLCAS